MTRLLKGTIITTVCYTSTHLLPTSPGSGLSAAAFRVVPCFTFPPHLFYFASIRGHVLQI